MKYEIKGDTLPVVICQLDKDESMYTESGGMAWMTPNLEMQTSSGGGFGKALGRALSGDSFFQSVYTAKGGPGMIAFASSFPGSIVPFEVDKGKEYILQKSAFLAAEMSVKLEIALQKKVSSGLFGGEGFILQKVSGKGIVFGEFDGHTVVYNLKAGEQLVIDSGHLAAMESTVGYEIKTIKGAKNVLFGGEGLFNTVLTGPGKVWLQTMPISNVADIIKPYLPTGN